MALRENDGGNHTTINQLLFVEVQAGVDGTEHEMLLVILNFKLIYTTE